MNNMSNEKTSTSYFLKYISLAVEGHYCQFVNTKVALDIKYQGNYRKYLVKC